MVNSPSEGRGCPSNRSTRQNGSCLALHTSELARLSIDVDIEVAKQLTREEIESVFDLVIVKSQIFSSWNEDQRTTTSPTSRHYRFEYLTNGIQSQSGSHIILDVVFVSESNPLTVEMDVAHPILSVAAPITSIRIASVESLLGDKLTAIATRTTGVPCTKELEMVKQIYDVHRLLSLDLNPDLVRNAFNRTILIQNECFGRTYARDEVLNDIRSRALASYHADPEFYQNGVVDATNRGIGSLQNYLVNNRSFRAESARLTLLRAAYYTHCFTSILPFIPLDKKSQATIERLPEEYSGVMKLPKTERFEAAYYLHKLLPSSLS